MSKSRRACADWHSESLPGIDKVIAKLPCCPMTAQSILLRTQNQIIDHLLTLKLRSAREQSLNSTRSIRVSIQSHCRVGTSEKLRAGVKTANSARAVREWIDRKSTRLNSSHIP